MWLHIDRVLAVFGLRDARGIRWPAAAILRDDEER